MYLTRVSVICAAVVMMAAILLGTCTADYMPVEMDLRSQAYLDKPRRQSSPASGDLIRYQNGVPMVNVSGVLSIHPFSHDGTGRYQLSTNGASEVTAHHNRLADGIVSPQFDSAIFAPQRVTDFGVSEDSLNRQLIDSQKTSLIKLLVDKLKAEKLNQLAEELQN